MTAALPTMAQAIVERTDTLSEVVVTGTGTLHRLKDVPVQTEVISRKMLDNYAGRSLEDMLGGLCSSLGFSPGDMGSNLQLNGMSNDYVLILIDGKRMNGDIGGQNDLQMINPDKVDHIEIVKGASSSLYGSDAIAGVINIVMKKNHDPMAVTNRTRLGQHGDVTESLSFSWKHKKWNSITDYNVRHTDGWRNTDKEYYHYDLLDGSVSRTVSRSTNHTLSEHLEYAANRRLTLKADGSFYQKWINRAHGNYQYNRYDYHYRNFSLAAGGKYQLQGRNYLQFDASYDKYNYYFDYTEIETTDYVNAEGQSLTYYPGMRILQTSQQKAIGSAKGVFYFGDTHVMNAGVEYMWDKLIAPTRMVSGHGEAYTMSAYAQDEWTLARRLVATGGLRYVYHKEFGQKVTPKLTLMYSPGAFNIRATYSMGFKAPTLKELYYQYITAIMGTKLKAYYGNRDLKPQTSNYGSLNVEYRAKKFDFNVTGYYNGIRNMIDLNVVPTSVTDKNNEVQETLQYKNLAKARSYGADVTLEYRFSQSLTVGAGYSYVDAKGQYTDKPSSKDFLKYTPISGTSYHTANWNVQWNHRFTGYRLTVGLFGNYRSKKYYLTDGNGDPYQLWRINTAHAFTGMKKWSLTLNAGVDNLFDYVDDTPFGRNHGTTTPGRNFYISALVKWGEQPKKASGHHKKN
jgi:outer membrane receptor for ferrienterochelin and colicins